MAKRPREEAIPAEAEHLPEARDVLTPIPSTSPRSPRKYAHLDVLPSSSSDATVMRCTLPPHKEPLTFSTYEDYEVHYKQSHVNRCSECRKNFPSNLFLTLHIEENHDSLVAARKEKGEKTYGCFVEGCERKCSTPQKRRLHLIDKHSFPRSYNFFIVNDGIDNQRSLLRSNPTQRRLSSLASSATAPPTKERDNRQNRGHHKLPNRPTIKETTPDLPNSSQYPEVSSNNPTSKKGISNPADISDLAKSLSALEFVPTSVRLRSERLSKNGTQGPVS